MQMCSSAVRISGLCFFPNEGMKYKLFCLLLIIHQGAVPFHLGHHIARLVMTQMISEKSLQKKKFPLPHQQKPTLSIS